MTAKMNISIEIRHLGETVRSEEHRMSVTKATQRSVQLLKNSPDGYAVRVRNNGNLVSGWYRKDGRCYPGNPCAL